jgi:hypothetical protein
MGPSIVVPSPKAVEPITPVDLPEGIGFVT